MTVRSKDSSTLDNLLWVGVKGRTLSVRTEILRGSICEEGKVMEFLVSVWNKKTTITNKKIEELDQNIGIEITTSEPTETLRDT